MQRDRYCREQAFGASIGLQHVRDQVPNFIGRARFASTAVPAGRAGAKTRDRITSDFGT
jgi:hypothetical protein